MREEGLMKRIGFSFAIIIKFRSEKTGQGEDFYAKNIYCAVLQKC